ncbi:IPT/TIG domain-containing protein [Patescibacteria group bacterium]|nr:IPT/TIG domain-containing protein [Patescibacteria group bacterium]
MNKLFEKLSQLSYPTVFFIASCLTVVSVLPLWIYISGQQTRFATKAVETASVVPSSILTPTDGPVPENPPTITRVYPWVGKAGDVIIIEGKNFGNYPKNRRLSIGDAIVADTDISSWDDTRIQAIIPDSPKEGGTVALRINAYPIVESLPLIFYDQTATIRLRKQGAIVSVEGVSGEIRATLFTQNGKPFGSPSTSSGFAQGEREITITAQPNEKTTLFTLSPNEEILTLLLADEKGAYIPYSINPIEFGF